MVFFDSSFTLAYIFVANTPRIIARCPSSGLLSDHPLVPLPGKDLQIQDWKMSGNDWSAETAETQRNCSAEKLSKQTLPRLSSSTTDNVSDNDSDKAYNHLQVLLCDIR